MAVGSALTDDVVGEVIAEGQRACVCVCVCGGRCFVPDTM